MGVNKREEIAILIETSVFMMSILVVLSLLALGIISMTQFFMGLFGYVAGLVLII